MKKTEYQQVIEACSSLATIDSMQRKLNKIHSTTEDSRLKALLGVAIAKLNAAYQAAVSQKSAGKIRNCQFRGFAIQGAACILQRVHRVG
jgi:hypothetical protein